MLIKGVMTHAFLFNGLIRVSLTIALLQGEWDTPRVWIHFSGSWWVERFFLRKQHSTASPKRSPPFSEPVLLISGSVPCSIWKPYCSVSKETANKQGLWYLLFSKSQAKPIAKALGSGSQKHLLSFQSWIFFLFYFSFPPPPPISTFVLRRKGSSQLYKQGKIKTELCDL